MKQHVIILGATGMLGSAVINAFLEQKDKYLISIVARPSTVFKDGIATGTEASPVIVSREFSQIFNLSDFHSVIAYDALDLNLSKLWGTGSAPDYVINCMGAIKPYFKEDDPHKYKLIYLNSVFPHYLSGYAKETGVKMIHITTDCVFSGDRGSYTEEDAHDATDLYGNSKSLGEPNNCMVLRTSIIGEEVHKNLSLIEWVKSQKGKTANGYVNHFWNGVTTTQYGNICDKIISENLYEEDLFHLFSPTTVNKYNLMSLINEKFSLNIDIANYAAEQPVDRSLSTVKLLNSKLNIPEISEQINLMPTK